HDQDEREWARADDLPLAHLDHAGRAEGGQRPGRGDDRAHPPRDRGGCRRRTDGRMKGARILVVDDDPGMLRATERVLAPQYEVTSCRTSREALQRAASCTPDIALLDVRMPDLSGFELRDALRGLCPDLDVIFMTGSLNHLDATFVHAIRAHAFYFVQK